MKICETSEPKFKLFGVSVRYNVNTGMPHQNIQRKGVFFLDGAFRYYRDKNMSHSAMRLIAECHTIFQAKSLKMFKSYPEAPYSAVERMAV
jgi:hypothetical protein